ncbi:ComEC/Rec2 family competence protein [Youxingia wuxianensis]|uniref:MBL fold metallo-hydrolase n=1 Tax=Youxingia wuxianensis TaxID=2763678 RepID=A0A926EJK4_9FIRM|nr:ComEC/Rec2 family competence protein [Youxingia wuxianensis]MBC8584553.1 MBL fold metallo-hydrolase [Youxingia wuxianensis]
MGKKKLPLLKIIIILLVLVTLYFAVLGGNQLLGGPIQSLTSMSDGIGRLLNTLYIKLGLSTDMIQAQGELQVHFIDVGQGKSILIKTPTANVLIDTGEADQSERLLTYLAAQNVSSLDLAVITHPHSDHMGGMAYLLEKLPVKKLMMPELNKELLPSDQGFENLLDKLSEIGLSITAARPGDSYFLGEEICFTILGPVKSDPTDLNENSIVSRLVYNKCSFLFTGDCGAREENDLLCRWAQALPSNVLDVGHHGSDTSTQQEWLTAVSPSIGVISCGRDNAFGHPSQTVLGRLKEQGVNIYRTDLNGSIVFGSDGENITVFTSR